MLTHWRRDRARGEQRAKQLPCMGCPTAAALPPGKKADLNLLGIANMQLHAPYMAFDLLTGDKRLLQKADVYRATIVSGEVIVDNGDFFTPAPPRARQAPRADPRLPGFGV